LLSLPRYCLRRLTYPQYRLYTVTPRLLSFIDLLTNWYVRFNRKRFKGDSTPQDKSVALNVLFEVLMSLAKMMVRRNAAPVFSLTAALESLHALLHGLSLPKLASPAA
jgi:isoleucyl-tRNA synthetase